MAGLTYQQLLGLGGTPPTQGQLQQMAGGGLSDSQMFGTYSQAPAQAPNLPPVSSQQPQQNIQQQSQQPQQQMQQQAPQKLTYQQLVQMGAQPAQQNQQGQTSQTQPAQQSLPTVGLDNQPITNAADATMYAQKLQQWQQQNANAASKGWLGQLINGIGRTGQSIGLGLRQDIAKVGNAVGLASNLDPNSPNYNPLLDVNSETAKAYQQLVAHGQTGWEKAGKTIGDIGSFLVPGGVGEAADALGAARGLGALGLYGGVSAEDAAAALKGSSSLNKLSTFAKIAGGDSEALAPYTQGILGKLGLTAADVAGGGTHLTQGGVLANRILANMVAGGVMNGVRSGKTTTGDLVGGALLATAGNAALGTLAKKLATPEENMVNLIKNNPENPSGALSQVKNFVTKTLTGKNGNDTAILNKYDLTKQEYDDVITQMAREGNLPVQKGAAIDTGANIDENVNNQKAYGQVINEAYKNTPGQVSLFDTAPGTGNGIVDNVIRDLKSNPDTYEQFLLNGGEKAINELPDKIQGQIDILNKNAGLPEGTPGTPDMYHKVVMKLESDAGKNIYGGPIDRTSPDAVIASSMRRSLATTMKNNANIAFGDGSNGGISGKQYADFIDTMNKNYRNSKMMHNFFTDMNKKAGPGTISQMTKHGVGLITGLGGAMTGLGGGSAGLGAGGYLLGKSATDIVGQPIMDYLENAKLGGQLFQNMPKLTPELAKTSALQSIMRAQQEAGNLKNVLEYLKANKK